MSRSTGGLCQIAKRGCENQFSRNDSISDKFIIEKNDDFAFYCLKETNSGSIFKEAGRAIYEPSIEN